MATPLSPDVLRECTRIIYASTSAHEARNKISSINQEAAGHVQKTLKYNGYSYDFTLDAKQKLIESLNYLHESAPASASASASALQSEPKMYTVSSSQKQVSEATVICTQTSFIAKIFSQNPVIASEAGLAAMGKNLSLTAGQQANVRQKFTTNGIHMAFVELLRTAKSHNPRALTLKFCLENAAADEDKGKRKLIEIAGGTK